MYLCQTAVRFFQSLQSLCLCGEPETDFVSDSFRAESHVLIDYRITVIGEGIILMSSIRCLFVGRFDGLLLFRAVFAIS